MNASLWWRLTEFGNTTILLPTALVMALWLLLAPATRRSGGFWLAAVVVTAAMVALSKLLYMGWRLHPPGLDFTGLSGDCAMAFLFWPAAGLYVSARAGLRGRALAIAVGVALALIVAVSRVLLKAHSVSEVVAGSVWGMLVVAVFLWGVWREPPAAPVKLAWLPIAALVLLLLASARHADFNRVLAWGALKMSGHTVIYTRCDLGPAACKPRK